MFCPICGNKVGENEKFCGKCGAQMKNAASETCGRGKHTAEENNAGKQAQKMIADTADAIKSRVMSYIQTWQNWKKMEGQEKYLWFGIHGGAVLLFCGIVIILAISGGSKAPEKNENMAAFGQEDGNGAGEIPGNENADGTMDEYEQPEEKEAHTALEVEGGNCEAGKSCIFGSYQMSGGADKVGIEWIILEVADNKIFVLSKYVLPELQAFNNVTDLKTIARWDSCSLRTWLNGSFYSNAFTDEQKSAIVTTQVGDYDNRMGSGSNYTQDKIFCLSVKEAGLYSDSLVGAFYDTGNPTTWWLRTEGETDLKSMGKYAAFVTAEGLVKREGFHNYQEIGVRPAMWIDLDMVSVVSY